ncbi:MAG: hypothetical protein M3P38_12700 [Chloroflexota bacterium]|nr:hypothetical protein [Chloroflexota bacterium]
MTPLRKKVRGAVVLALMILALTANVAAADEGGSNLDIVPYDPGLPGEEAPPPSPPPVELTTE